MQHLFDFYCPLCKQAEIQCKLLPWLRFRISDPAKRVPKMFLTTLPKKSVCTCKEAQLSRAEGLRHPLPEGCQIRTKDVLGGLHHEYWLEKVSV